MRPQLRTISVVLLLCALLTPAFSLKLASAQTARPAALPSEAERLAGLERRLEALREELKIPALSAVIVKDQKVQWAKGFGYADVEQKIPATEHTPFHLASLTKTFASTIVMQLVEQGKVNLDDPVAKYGIHLESPGVIRVRHLMSHTSEGNPGERYSYNGNRFGELDKVVERATGKSFAELLLANIIEPLGMDESAPNVPPLRRLASNEADRGAREEVLTTVRNFIAAYNKGDIDELEKHIAPQSSGFRSGGGVLDVLEDTQELRGAFRSGLKVDLQTYDMDAAVQGDHALATFLLTETVRPPNAPPRPTERLRASYFLTRQDGAWKLFHVHYSELESAPASEQQRQRFERITKTLAQPYGLDAKSNVVKIKYPTYFGTSAGLMASVLDMAKYSIAIDQHRFLKPETQQLAFTPAVSTRGQPLPYGLGWFTQNYNGLRLIWHYGYWTGNSSLILRVPERNLTFIAMANTDNLSRPTDLGSGDVTSSPVGLAFLKAFIFPERFGQMLPEINWAASPVELQSQLRQLAAKPYGDIFKKELMMRVRIYGSTGRRDEARRMTSLFGEIYLKPLPAELAKRTPVAQLARVADEEDKTAEFTLTRPTRLRVFAIGEALGGKLYDFGWIEEAAEGKRVWEMKEAETTHAGGAEKNRLADTIITLPAGRYRLRFKSDDSHSFDNWNALPPDTNFWGIALYEQN